MSKREGSSGHRELGIDLLEGRFLLSSLHGYGSATTPTPVASEVAHRDSPSFEDDILYAAHADSRLATARSAASDTRVDYAVSLTVAPNRRSNLRLRTSGPDADLLKFVGVVTKMSDEGTSGSQPRGQTASPDLSQFNSIAYTTPSTTGHVIYNPGERAMVTSLASWTAPMPGLLADSLAASRLEGRADRGALGSSSEAGVIPPRGSDLLSNFLPFDRGPLEQAFGRFFDRLHEFGAELPGSEETPGTLPELFVTLAALAMLELGRRSMRRSEDDDADPGEPFGSTGIGHGGSLGLPARLT